MKRTGRGNVHEQHSWYAIAQAAAAFTFAKTSLGVESDAIRIPKVKQRDSSKDHLNTVHIRYAKICSCSNNLSGPSIHLTLFSSSNFSFNFPTIFFFSCTFHATFPHQIEELKKNWNMATKIAVILWACWLSSCIVSYALPYDPNDASLKDILLPEGQFEAFYLKGSQEEEQNAVRPPHLHGSFNQYRNPALVGVPNSAAYGFRFDGKRRFNFD